MKAILRTAVLAAGTAALVATSTPASATTAGAFEGTAELNCFGCGTRTTGNHAELNFYGVFDGEVVAPATGVVDSSTGFTINEPTGPTCVVTGDANGNVIVNTGTRTVTVKFNWTRIGATAVITTEGFGTGSAAFKVVEPVGVPCGQRVVATFAGDLAG